MKGSRTQDSLITWAHAHLSPHFAPNFCPHFAPKTSEKGKSGTFFLSTCWQFQSLPIEAEINIAFFYLEKINIRTPLSY